MSRNFISTYFPCFPLFLGYEIVWKYWWYDFPCYHSSLCALLLQVPPMPSLTESSAEVNEGGGHLPHQTSEIYPPKYEWVNLKTLCLINKLIRVFTDWLKFDCREELAQLFQWTESGTKIISRVALSGELRKSRFRSIVWQILLGILPYQSCLWVQRVRQRRAQYQSRRDLLLINPHESGEDDHPLSQEDSVRKAFCSSNILLYALLTKFNNLFPDRVLGINTTVIKNSKQPFERMLWGQLLEIRSSILKVCKTPWLTFYFYMQGNMRKYVIDK